MAKIKNKLLSLIPETSYHYDRVMFLENSNGLYYKGAADAFREFLIENKIRHHVIYNLNDMNDSELLEIAKSCLDTLVAFETTGVSENFQKLVSYFIKLTNEGYRFRFLECSVYNFQFYKKPDKVGGGYISHHNLECCGDSLITEDWVLTEIYNSKEEDGN